MSSPLTFGVEMREREAGWTAEGSKRDRKGILRRFEDRKAEFWQAKFLEVS